MNPLYTVFTVYLKTTDSQFLCAAQPFGFPEPTDYYRCFYLLFHPREIVCFQQAFRQAQNIFFNKQRTLKN